MRPYMIVLWIFPIYSVLHFALAAPKAVVRSSAVDVLQDGMATWRKRMDPDVDRSVVDKWCVSDV
jgi:hypothetical protein